MRKTVIVGTILTLDCEKSFNEYFEKMLSIQLDEKSLQSLILEKIGKDGLRRFLTPEQRKYRYSTLNLKSFEIIINQIGVNDGILGKFDITIKLNGLILPKSWYEDLFSELINVDFADGFDFTSRHYKNQSNCFYIMKI